jgi:hypothetical protein
MLAGAALSSDFRIIFFISIAFIVVPLDTFARIFTKIA